MTKEDIRRMSLQDIREKHERGELVAVREDAPTHPAPDGFWENAKPVFPPAKTPISLRVDSDILEFFKRDGEGHLTRMHGVLRAYVDAQKKRGAAD